MLTASSWMTETERTRYRGMSSYLEAGGKVTHENESPLSDQKNRRRFVEAFRPFDF
jgi:hypothetical protein